MRLGSGGDGRRGGGRRLAGARPMKSARGAVPARPPDAALGRGMRGLVAPARGGRAAGSSGGGQSGVTLRRAAGRLRGPARIFSPARAGGLLGMLASGFLLTLVTGPTAFGLSRTDLPELAWTGQAAVADALALQGGANVFRLDTQPLEAALAALPAVASADVSVALPDAAVVVRIQERTPVLAWQIGETRFIVDGEGAIFAQVDRSATLPAGLAIVDDRRQGAISLHRVGGHLDPIDLDVATRLGSLVPADVGSAAEHLRVAVTDDDGFVVTTLNGWTAVFGFYSPATRSTGMIPGQVRLLRSFLEGREASARRIVLASETFGTYIPRPTPR